MKLRSRRSVLFAVPMLAAAVSSRSAHAAEAQPPRPPATTLKKAAAGQLAVDDAGFIRRWLVLEPISVNGRLTTSEVEKAVQQAPWQAADSAMPRDGDIATPAGQPLRWHALDTLQYNLNLYHFAWPLSKPTSNVLFWTTTVVVAPHEMRDVRLAIGSNAASVWWLNGERVIALYNDRQAVIDDGVSPRVTLRKGPNLIRAAIVNGGGATDFCARFLDAQDRPVRTLVATLAP